MSVEYIYWGMDVSWRVSVRSSGAVLGNYTFYKIYICIVECLKYTQGIISFDVLVHWAFLIYTTENHF